MFSFFLILHSNAEYVFNSIPKMSRSHSMLNSRMQIYVLMSGQIFYTRNNEGSEKSRNEKIGEACR